MIFRYSVGSTPAYSPKSGAEFALGFVSDLAGNVRNAAVGGAQKLHGMPDAVFFHIRSNGLSVNTLEHLFQGGGVYQIFLGKRINGDTAVQVLGQIFVDRLHQLRLLGLVGIYLFFLRKIRSQQKEEKLLDFQSVVGQAQFFRNQESPLKICWISGEEGRLRGILK